MKKLLFILLTAISCMCGFSQDTIRPAKKWAFIIEPYLMIPNMNGTTGLGTIPDIQVDANAGDIFSHLKMGAMLNMEASSPKWAVISDIIYMNLKQDVTASRFIKSGNINAKQFAWELAALYRLSPLLEIGAGTLLNSLKMGVNIDVNNIGGGSTATRKEMTKTWVDPMFMARIKSKPGEKFVYSLRGEIGGFGIGADFTWQVQAYAGYRFSKLFQLTGGYRVISIDYNDGTGDDRFLYNMNTFGPVVRLGFNL